MANSTASWQARQAPAPVLGVWQFTQASNAANAFPGSNHGIPFDSGAVTENDMGNSGMTVSLAPAPPNVSGTPILTTGSRSVLVTMDINTLGTGNHSAFAQLRDPSVSGNNNPFPGSVVGEYGQGSSGAIASVVIPPNTTKTISRRGGVSAENQILQAGSFLRLEELA